MLLKPTAILVLAVVDTAEFVTYEHPKLTPVMYEETALPLIAEPAADDSKRLHVLSTLNTNDMLLTPNKPALLFGLQLTHGLSANIGSVITQFQMEIIQ